MLHELIRNARRRLLLNEILKQFALSAALAIGGLALLLTLGTRYLQWWVVALFAAAVTAWAFIKLRKKLPGDYAAAVWLDEKAGLHDSLSTAHYFAKKRTGPRSPETEALLLAQRGQAEAAAGAVNVSLAVPFRFPKALYGLAALLLLSTGLITVRYFYGHNLNLTAPITEVIFPDLAAIRPPAKKAAKPPANPKTPEDYDAAARSLLANLGIGADLDQNHDESLDHALADALKTGEKTPADGNAAPDPKTDKADPLDKPDAAKSSNNSPAENNSDKKSGDNGNPPGQNSGASGERSEKSLLSKLKDAMDNMMSSATAQGDKKSAGKSQPSKSSDKAQSGQQTGNPGDQENKEAANGEANGAAQKSNSPGQTSGSQSDKQEGPSAAAEDGEKAIKAAAQMKAMGKISELIGKRSEEVTGDSMIDVQSGDQRLQTAYKNEAATHGEGAGDVSRDEIPLAEQSYVQEYFEQVRKPAASAGTAAKKPATDKAPAPAPPPGK